ncbi:hypothetical protein BJ684DRAFT_15225 [Piptocephalis cylindrospora]|uniref:Uncharacterized protein n=1 Tax=Piptocephalis cylindrospora TaxID=1907219 RepID=A0A4P9Y6M9_9FUNG|nr:hypothetical protein BJ684DRAFT_15225 [Piptocephalis cylindrospora]|eukprot:RKP14452.1 hypothetical protein BJ684DRAFT_15225 [Piptocephalis cylindrospora]
MPPYPSIPASYNVHQQGHPPQAKKSRSHQYAHPSWYASSTASSVPGPTLSPPTAYGRSRIIGMSHSPVSPPSGTTHSLLSHSPNMVNTYTSKSQDLTHTPGHRPLRATVPSTTPHPTGTTHPSLHRPYWQTHPHLDSHGRREEPEVAVADSMPIYLSPPPSMPVTPAYSIRGSKGEADSGKIAMESPSEQSLDLKEEDQHHVWDTIRSTPTSPQPASSASSLSLPDRGRPRVGHRRTQSATLASLSIERTNIRTFYTASGRTRSPIRTADRLAGALVLMDPTVLMERYRSVHYPSPPEHVKKAQTEPLPCTSSSPSYSSSSHSSYPSYSSTSLLPPPAPTQMDTQVRSVRSMAISELLNPVSPSSSIHASNSLISTSLDHASGPRKRPRSPTPPMTCKVLVHPDPSTQGFSL